MKQKATDEQVKQAVLESISFSETMRKLGMTPRGASYQWFRSRVRKLGLDFSHFRGKAAGGITTAIKRKLHWKEVLVENKFVRDGTRLRKAFTEFASEHGISYCCASCKQLPHWNGQPLMMQLDHIDENRSNNTPENLQWVCPNCHFQKSMTAVRNSARKYYCVKCHSQYPGYGQVCLKCSCSTEWRTKIHYPSTEEISKLLEDVPLVDACQKLGIKQTALRQFCKRNDIPTKPRGYWLSSSKVERRFEIPCVVSASLT